MTRVIPEQCINFIAKHEGWRSKAYYDAVGVLTIGWGHTGSDVFVGQVISEQQGKELLIKDLAYAASAVDGTGIKFNDNEFSALVSFEFNVGSEAFLTSTLLKKIKAGAPAGEIRAEFERWVHGNNKEVLPGLVTRRRAEADLYFKPIEKGASPTVSSPEPAKPSSAVQESIPNADNIIKFYTGLPHQKATLEYAIEYFIANAKPAEISKFIQLWRNVQQHAKESVPTKPGVIDWKNSSQKISAYFSVGEVTQGDSRRIPTDPQVIKNILDLAKKLDELREDWGKLRLGTSAALGVTSWYRPEAVNREVGGVSNSAHIKGYAADIYPLNSQPGDTELREFQAYCEEHWVGGVGRGAYKGFVHLDLGAPRTWDY